jgi:hypothetical protein
MPRSRTGGRLSSQGTQGAGQLGIRVHVRVEGLDRTEAEFKRISREVNGRMRDVMVRVGERKALPQIRARFPTLSESTDRGLAKGAMAGSLRVQRERSGVFISSRLRKAEDRALGWIDFGGKRPRDSGYRAGTKVIVTTLDRLRPTIDKDVLDELMHEFRDFT